MKLRRGVKRKREVMFCGKKEIGRVRQLVRISRKKISFWERIEKSQEQEDIARREFDSVAFCSSNQVRVG